MEFRERLRADDPALGEEVASGSLPVVSFLGTHSSLRYEGGCGEGPFPAWGHSLLWQQIQSNVGSRALQFPPMVWQLFSGIILRGDGYVSKRFPHRRKCIKFEDRNNRHSHQRYVVKQKLLPGNRGELSRVVRIAIYHSFRHEGNVILFTHQLIRRFLSDPLFLLFFLHPPVTYSTAFFSTFAFLCILSDGIPLTHC